MQRTPLYKLKKEEGLQRTPSINARKRRGYRENPLYKLKKEEGLQKPPSINSRKREGCREPPSIVRGGQSPILMLPIQREGEPCPGVI